MRNIFLITALLPLLISASTPPTLLFARATCQSSDVVCGSICIPEGYTCCPDKEGGCSAKEQCQKGSNGVYGCCPEGETCEGVGGSEFVAGGGSSDNRTQSTIVSTDSDSSNTNGATAAVGVGVGAWAVVGALVMVQVL